MSTFKTVAKGKVAAARKPSNKKTATVNRAGDVAFEVKDSALKLITMTGGSFFAEPRFYNAEVCIPKRVVGGKFDKLVERLELTDTKVKAVASCDELNEVAREVIATAVDVASGKSPEDILAIANWLRNEANIRLTPQVLLVIASRFDGSKSLVRKYTPHIVKRPDEVKSVLLAHRFFFGMKSLPNGLAHGLGDAIGKFGERGLMKYDSPDFPTWKDVLCWLPRKAGWPLTNEVAKYFITGNVVDAAKTPVISARKELAKLAKFDKEAKDLVKKSFANWEVVLSQFPKDKAAVWSFLIDEGLVGYMALLRNLRNILQVGVSAELVQKVSDKLSNKDEVLRSKQLPFRFLAAKRAVEGMGGAVDGADFSELMAAVELAANEACANIPPMPGVTVIFADNSGSMDDRVSEKSEMSCKDAANMLAGIVAKVAERPYVCAFGEDLKEVRFAKTDTVIGIAEKVCGTYVGGSTNGFKCVEWLARQSFTPSRVIMLSDMQMWRDRTSSFNNKSPFCDLWAKYVKSGKGKDTWLHSIHLNGYGDNVVDEGAHVNQVAGFTEKVFTMLLQTEGVVGVKALPTLDQIREKWTVK